MCGEKRFDEVADRMIAEVGRDIADAQPAVGLRAVAVRSRIRHPRPGVHLVPAPAFGIDVLGRGIRVHTHAEQQIAVRRGMVRSDLEGLAE